MRDLKLIKKNCERKQKNNYKYIEGKNLVVVVVVFIYIGIFLSKIDLL